MKNKLNLHLIIHKCLNAMLIIGVLLLVSCVGTVKTADSLNTKSSSVSSTVITSFDGIKYATGISSSKVEIFFPPLTDGYNSDEYVYVLTYDGLTTPIYINASSLYKDYQGLYRYTVSKLQAGTSYNFNIQLRNTTTNVQSAVTQSATAKTFSNTTANFEGVSEVRNISGSDGMTSIQIVWPESETLGTATSPKDGDPISYEVTLINSNYLTPSSMNDATYSEPMRKTLSVSSSKKSVIATGLKPGTKYYVQVRSIHNAYSDNSANPSYKVEENTKYLEIATYSDQLADLKFDNSSFFLTWPAGEAGLYSLIGNWSSASGNFDHYRIYYTTHGTTSLGTYLNGSTATNVLCNGKETNNTSVYCQYVGSNYTSFKVTGLSPYTSYDMILAVCLTSTCQTGYRVISYVATKMTFPNVASFNGISSIDTSSNLDDLDKLILNFPQPTDGGFVSGYYVDYYGNDITSTPVTLNDGSNTTSLYVDSFNYLSATSITVHGIDYNSGDKYCFMVYPFTYNSSNAIVTYKNGLTPICIIPTLKAPTGSQFGGVSSQDCGSYSDRWTIRWQLPTGGIYNKFELFYVKASSFNFDDALNYASNSYNRILLNKSVTEYQLTNLGTGTYYVGVRSYYYSTSGELRSEVNSNIYNCTF
jgi:hypothetical protein